MATFDRSYWSAIVSIALSCIISQIKRDTGGKSRCFILPCIRRPRYGSPHWSIVIVFGTKKLGWCGYPTVKNVADVFSRFDRIPACDRRTDILRQHSPRYAWHRVVKTYTVYTVQIIICFCFTNDDIRLNASLILIIM